MSGEEGGGPELPLRPLCLCKKKFCCKAPKKFLGLENGASVRFFFFENRSQHTPKISFFSGALCGEKFLGGSWGPDPPPPLSEGGRRGGGLDPSPTALLTPGDGGPQLLAQDGRVGANRAVHPNGGPKNRGLNFFGFGARSTPRRLVDRPWKNRTLKKPEKY